MIKSRLKILSLFWVIFGIAVLFSACWKALIIGGTIDHLYLMDGVYEGRDSHGPNKVVVRVTVEDNRIAKIEVEQNWGMRAGRIVPDIPDRIIEEQSTQVDAITGATNSSHVFMNAVHDAILKAMRRISSYQRSFD